MNGLTVDKLLVLLVIAVFVIGPERLPDYALKLRRIVKQAKTLIGEAKGRAAEELGPDFEVDWKKLDPRQYDPRRIVREALLDGEKPFTFDLAEQKPGSTPTKGLALGGQAARPGGKPHLK